MRSFTKFMTATIASAALLAGVFGAFAQDAPVTVVNPGFEDGTKGWSLPPNYTVVNDVSHSGKASLRITNTDPEVYQLSSQELKFQPEASYHFSVWVKTQGVVGNESGATICIEYWDAKGGYLGGSYPSGLTGNTDWTLVEGEISAMPEKTAKVNMAVYLRKGMTGTAWFDDISIVPFYGQPLDCGLIKPAYRGTLYEDSRDQQILIYARVAQKFAGGYKVGSVKLSCKVFSGDNVVMQKTIKPKAGVNKITMDARRIPVGEYKIIVDLMDPSGIVADTRDLVLKKLTAGTAKPTVYTDEYGRTIRNGKPYFPFGFYFGPNPNSDGSYKEHIDRISNSPFNTIMPYGINVYNLGTIREYLDYLDKKNVCILYSLKDILKGIAYYEENMLGLGDEKGQITGIVNAFKDHPALLGWYLNDEAPPKFQSRLMERYRMVKALDANHPTWSVLCDPGSLFAYLETCDVLGTDPYPINRAPITTAANWAAATVKVSGGHRSVWMVPQVMDWNCYGYDKTVRAPSLDEMIVMSYLCLIEGAKGMIYYSYFDLQRDTLGFDKRWKDVMVMGNEIEKLIPAVMSIKKPMSLNVQSNSEDIRQRVFADDNGKNFVLMANTNKNKAAVLTVSIPKGYKAELLKHAQTSDVTSSIVNGKLTVTMSPTQAATVIISK